MKASSATSAKAIAPARPTGPSSASPPTRTSAEGFALTGPSDPPDPKYHAYRRDLADVALAGRVIASHFARPLERKLGETAPLRTAASPDAEVIEELAAGESFHLLEDSRGWAWGYAGQDRRVGYVRSETLS